MFPTSSKGDSMAAEPSSNGMLWAGWIVTGLVILFLVFDGATKILKVAPVLGACAKLGVSSSMAVGIGTVLLICTAIYALPQTAVLGAILLTAYLGGAVAIHVRGGSGVFETAFAVGFGGLVWLGLVLRDPRLLWTILLRQ
jgi:DoxX-like family